MRIAPLTPADIDAWTNMRRRLGPEWLLDNVDAMIRGYLENAMIDGLPHVVLIAKDESGEPVGFAEVSLRAFAEGCDSHPVGYLEGWFVEESARGTGVGRALVEAGERWASEQGCTEFASDAETHNTASIAAHQKLGFERVCEIVCFRRRIGS